MKDHITPHSYQVNRSDRRKLNNHNSFLIWFTGLSGSGKSTIANIIEQELFKKGVKTYILDGDNIRKGVNNDLTFSPEDRTENIRRIAEVSNLLVDAGLVVLAAFVSPYKKDRENIRNIVKDVNFVEVFVDASVGVCEQRDVKGLYKKARQGEIKNMTGISAPYESPEKPDIILDTDNESIEQSVKKVMDYITPKLKLNRE